MRIFVPFLLLSALLDCGGSAEETPAEPQRVENASLGIALLDVPIGFELHANEGSRLELVRQEGARAGRAWFELGPEQEAGINLVDVVNAQKEAYLGLPSGEFSGNREIQMGNGRGGYYSRGTFEHEGQRVEEFRISTLHPVDNRLMQVFYRYPLSDDSADRLTDILLLLDEIEALPSEQSEVTEDVTE